MNVKPSWKTGEFWLTILTQVPTLAGVFLGASNPVTAAIGAVSAIAYTLIRTQHKTAVLSAALQGAAKGATDPDASR